MTAPFSVEQGDIAVERTRQLFRFLKAFAERNVPLRRTLGEQPWHLRLAELPSHESVHVGAVVLESSVDEGQTGGDAGEETVPLIRVRRPGLTDAPEPDQTLRAWIAGPWRDPLAAPPSAQAVIERTTDDGETVTERLNDDPAREAAVGAWLARWSEWAERERPARRAMWVFEQLYAVFGRIERESERVELVLADGRVRRVSAAGGIDHPVLLQRVELHFDPAIPEFRVTDSDRGPELYTQIIADAEELSGEQLNQLQSELEAGGYHPLAENGTGGYLKRLANSLGARTRFLESGEAPRYGDDATITRDRVLLLRLRSSGMPAAFERVLQDLGRDDAATPTALSRVVGVEPPAPPAATDSAPSLSPWGEPPDVLLSKPANLEQVRIARALERHRAVLVQGPPGTGKSHTIANLVGHLVAQGQRVLVTSHTTKALRVLREHVVEALRPLCVALLEQDLEGRAQLEQAVRGIVARVAGADEDQEAVKAAQGETERLSLIEKVEGLQSQLREAREAEYRELTCAGAPISPSDAAREVRATRAAHEWLPARIELGAPLPLSAAELAALYRSNASVTAEEERELLAVLPPVDRLLTADDFAAAVAALDAARTAEPTPFWDRPAAEDDAEELAALDGELTRLADAAALLAPWQRRVAAAGCDGDAERALWDRLRDQVETALRAYERDRELLLTHDVTVAAGAEPTPADARETARAIAEHLKAGGRLGALVLLTRPKWKALMRGALVDGRAPAAESHFAAIAADLDLQERRRAVAQRWNKQAVPAGLPEFVTLPEPPERRLRDYAAQFDGLLGWWGARWATLAPALRKVEFRWDAFRNQHVAHSLPTSDFDRDLTVATGPLRQAVAGRLSVARGLRAERELAELRERLTGHGGQIAAALRRAVDDRDAAVYAEWYEELAAVTRKAAEWAERRRLLERLEAVAPAWAAAVRERRGVHGETAVPGDAPAAWRWRQLASELDRRAALDERDIAQKLEQERTALRAATTALIDTKAWLAQLRRTGLSARQALLGWADTQKKIGKGTGKRVPALQAKARALLSQARDAVPVWIMPLARVAESFDPRARKFDVVIVDEASQSDVTGLLAFYLGERLVIVGDNEQVSPSAVGEEVEAVEALQAQHLVSIPNAHLYDGKTSIYDLARHSFGGTIALQEHFRCVPAIIDFSNFLSYEGAMRPLRDPATAPLPHVVEYVVTGALGPVGRAKTNVAEARTTAALVAAMTEMPEYARKTIGAISLVGDEQALEIQQLALSLVGAVQLEAHRFAVGNPAQFQGDERHVMLLSMVDAPPAAAGGVLRRREEPTFKQRYNVAVSRARDQLWLVHSLDPARHLAATDLRRRLIDHVRDPRAMRRALTAAERAAESVFEREVIRHLIARGYRVQPQVDVGHYRIDLVVHDGDRRVAVECDGDRFHPVEKIPEDLARQAVLERLEWRFVRLRGTAFFRDPEATMSRVYEELARHGVHPSTPVGANNAAPEGARGDDGGGAALRDKVVGRAQAIMRECGWLPREATETVDEAAMAVASAPDGALPLGPTGVVAST